MDNLINGYPFSLMATGNRNGKEIGALQGDGLGFGFRIVN